MNGKLDIYILGDYRPGLPDGLAEFSYQNVTLLKDRFNFHFVEFHVSQNQDYLEEHEVDGVMVHVFGVRRSLPWTLSSYFKNWVRELPVQDILFHINHIYNFHNFLVVRILRKYKIKYVHTPHDAYVYGSEFKKTRQFLKRIYRALFVFFIDKYVLDHATLIHALTNKCVSYLRLTTNSPIMVVSNQVHDMIIDYEPALIQPMISFVGRNDFYQKGVDRALKGFSLFKIKAKWDDIQLVLIGPSNPSGQVLRDSLIKELRLVNGEDVILAGKIPDSERNQFLQQSKAYIHLSRFEGFGLSVIQALSSYKPVIVSRQIPISDKIVQYNAGFVVETPEETANAISAIFSFSEEQYRVMSFNARRCYEKEFHPDIIKPKLTKLYETAADGGKSQTYVTKSQ